MKTRRAGGLRGCRTHRPRVLGGMLGVAMALAVAGLAQAGPAVALSPGPLDFGNQGAGIASAARTLAITSSGSSSLAIHSISLTGADPGDFLISSDSGEATLAPGASRTVGIQLRPLAVGARGALLAVSDNGPGSPQMVTLSGSGVMTYVNRSPRNVDLGSVPVGGAVEQTVTVRNDWNFPLHISGLSIWYGGQYTGVNFYWKSASSLPLTLAPGASTEITVGARPSGTGASSATLIITDDAPFSPHLVSLAANAVAALVSIHPDPLDFQLRLFGGAATTMGIGIRNDSRVPLTIRSIQITGPNAADFTVTYDSGEGTVAPSQQRDLGIQFKPGGLGPRQALMSVSYNALGSPHQVLLKGFGVSTYVPRWPSNVDFGTRAVGTTREQVVTIRNDNPANNLHIDTTRIAIFGPNAGDFYWRPSAGFHANLPYGFTTDFIVGFRPGATGSKTAVLAIVDNAPYSPHNVPLSGTGYVPSATVPPARPGGLFATAGKTAVTVRWADQSDNETAFAIWRMGGGADWARIGVTPPNTTSFVDTGLAPNVLYTYRARATNNAGASAWSNEVSTRLGRDVDPPAAPTGLAGTGVAARQVTLTWTDNSDNETAFAIWRETGGVWSRVGVVFPNTTAFTDTGLTPSTTYTYWVRATNNNGASAWSNPVTVTTPAGP